MTSVSYSLRDNPGLSPQEFHLFEDNFLEHDRRSSHIGNINEIYLTSSFEVDL